MRALLVAIAFFTAASAHNSRCNAVRILRACGMSEMTRDVLQCRNTARAFHIPDKEFE